MHYEQGRRHGDAAVPELEHRTEALEHAIRMAPNRVDLHLMLGAAYATRAERDPAFWPAATAEYRRAVELYPTSARLELQLANVLEQSGEPPGARNAARRALELDQETPHPDKKLSDAERHRLLEWLGQPNR